jgi:lysozyme family protein
MANFDEAYLITMNIEGGWDNDSVDKGKETYKGISRKFHPSWSGWSIIDNLKLKPGFPNTAYSNDNLNSKVKEFYKITFWDINSLSEIQSQVVANELFDIGVNMGTPKAAKFLQTSLNVLNKNGATYPNVAEDGKMGAGTLKAFKICINSVGEDVIYKILNILQGQFYIDIMLHDPSQEKFALGWLKRVNFLKIIHQN